MASKRKKAAPEYLPPAERILAAKFLATSNLGQPEPRSADPAEVNRAWAECRMAHEAEGIDVTEEYDSWLRCSTTRSGRSLGTTWRLSCAGSADPA